MPPSKSKWRLWHPTKAGVTEWINFVGEPKDFAAGGWIIVIDQPNLKLYQYPTRTVVWDWRLLWKENK